MLGSANYMAVLFCHCDERSIFHENKEISFPAAVGGADDDGRCFAVRASPQGEGKECFGLNERLRHWVVLP